MMYFLNRDHSYVISVTIQRPCLAVPGRELEKDTIVLIVLPSTSFTWVVTWDPVHWAFAKGTVNLMMIVVEL